MLQDFAIVLGLAAMPAIGNFLGAVFAEIIDLSDRGLSLALHLAAGIVMAVVGLELMPEAMGASAPWVPILAFAAGGVAFLGIKRGIGSLRRRLNADAKTAGPLAIFSGVALDLFSDGVMIGTATVLNPGLGLLLAIGQVPADAPEGFAASAALRDAGIPRRTRIPMALSFAVPILVGATLGFFALQSAPELVTLSVLALTGGVLISVVAEEMIAEAHDGASSVFDAIALTVGFAIFAVITVYVGGSSAGG